MKCPPKRPHKPPVLTEGQRERPYLTYSEYANATAAQNERDPFSWYLFEEYNAHVKRTARDVFYVFDVFNMTVLRKDGHNGGGDCLHYRPGPGDWWNTLLLTLLRRMVQCPAPAALS
jgi:hypothetical protein